MRLKLATKFSSAIVGVVALAVSCSVATLLSARYIAGLMEETVTKNLPSLRAAEELEIALLEQRGLVVSFIVDNGNSECLKNLQHKKQDFHDALDQARKTAHTSGEERVLDSLEQVYREYDEKRDEMIALHQRGASENAKTLFLHKVSSLSRQTDRLCQEFIAENKRHIDSTTTRAQNQIRRITWMVGGFVGLTIGLGVLLLWMFFHGVFFPLQKMIADARDFTGEVPAHTVELPGDELRTADIYLHSLMSGVADTRSSLEESRRQLMNAEKLATAGKLAASGVAHEIRNPLTAVKMWLFSIHKGVGHTPELERKFEIVSEEIERLENIVHNFLELSRPPLLELRAQSVSRFIDETLELFGHRIEEKGIRLVRDDAVDLPPVMADTEQLKQVLINLLDNAVDATSKGSEIRILVDMASGPGNHPMVVVRVQDTGTGMPQDVRERIFEPFYTTKQHGMGLGLCIAAGVMARHDGRLVLESSTERGTTFAAWIPVAQEEVDEQNPGS